MAKNNIAILAQKIDASEIKVFAFIKPVLRTRNDSEIAHQTGERYYTPIIQMNGRFVERSGVKNDRLDDE
jgi:hypothetical protein